jgi:sulfotransferase famil protein
VIFFLHVPRAGGTTLRDVITRRYVKERVLTHDDSSSTRGWEEKVRRAPRDVALVAGHLPSDAPMPRHDPPLRRVTFLREPVARVISDYAWARQSPSSHIARDYCTMYTLREAIERRCYRNFDNLQVRLFSGALEEPWGQLTKEHLHDAVRALATFDFVGLTERMDRQMRDLEDAFPEWSGIGIELERKGISSRLGEVDAGTLAAVRDANLLDAMLYRWARFLSVPQAEEGGGI